MTNVFDSIICKTEADTKKLAAKLANLAQPGDVFALYGTLGAGKTAFSRHFIQALCPVLDVPSPTFTLLQTYDTEKFEIYHYDFYRLKNPIEAYELDIETAFYSAVCLAEWPEKIGNLLPKDVIKITISVKGNTRIFDIEVNDMKKYERFKEAIFG